MKLERRSFISSLPGWILAGFNRIQSVSIFRSVTPWWSALLRPEKNGKAERLRAWNSEYRKMKIDGTVVPFCPESISALLALSEEALASMTSSDRGGLETLPPCATGRIATVLSGRYGPESQMSFESFMEIIDLEDEIGLQKLADEMEIECGENGEVTPQICRQRHLSLAALDDPSLCRAPKVCVKKHLSWIGHCISTETHNGLLG